MIVEKSPLWPFGIDVSFLRGQGYDGAASMAGKLRGAQAVVQQTNPLAIYSHCAAHNFNLIVVSDACGVPLVRNSLGTMETVRTFFNTPKRKHVLNGLILDSDDDIRIRSLKRVSVTRWMERLHSASNFTELYSYILSALEKIQEFENKDTSREAMALLATITKGEFVVTMLMLSQLFGLGEPVCRQLQRVDIDFSELMNVANDLVEELTRLREDADSQFKLLFNEAQQLASNNSVEIKLPRVTQRQTQRANPDVAHDVETYYRVSVYIPFLDAFITSLNERFINHRQVYNSFACLLPRTSDQLGKIEAVAELFHFYASDPLLSDLSTVKGELKLFHQRLSRLSNLPRNAMDALAICDKVIYPNVFRLLQLLATLPVSSASNERSFSTLKRIKTYLRNSVGEARLNGLAMLSIHRDIDVDVQTVIDDLAKLGSRRLQFVL